MGGWAAVVVARSVGADWLGRGVVQRVALRLAVARWKIYTL